MNPLFIDPLFLGKIGMSELLIILLCLVIFFGGKKIPELMRGMGRGVREFKDAMDKPVVDDKPASDTTAKPVSDNTGKPASDSAQKPEEK